jgi:hypothetical protein
MRNSFRRFHLLLGVLPLLAVGVRADFDAEFYEEDAGMGVSVDVNPVDGVYGLGYTAGTWLRETPIFGNLLVTTFHSDIEESYYGGIGMIFRIMPHWKFAPFAGAGATYNYPIWDDTSDSDARVPANTVVKEPEEFWGVHAEAGLRMWFGEDQGSFIEALGRYTWSSIEGDHDYWTGSLGYGQRF